MFGLLLLISATVFSQTDSINKLDEKGLKNGKWEKVENGKTVYRGQFVHGQPMGKFTYFYDDGKTLKSISEFYKNGITRTITYHYNGKISSQGKFISQIKDSIWVYFGDNGKKIAEEAYLGGKKNGIWRQYDYETGKLLEETGWKNDLQHGLMQAWSMNEKLRYKIDFKQGKANGPYFVYHTDGSLSEKGVYRNSLKDSITTYFDESGKIIRKLKFNHGATDWDHLWVWNSTTGKKEVDMDSIAYVLNETRSYTVTTIKGVKIKGDGDWSQFVEILQNKGFIYYTPMLIGTIKAPKKLIELEEGVYKVVFKQEVGFDVIVNEADLAFLKAIRPNLFKKK